MNNSLTILDILQRTYGSEQWTGFNMTRYCYYDYVRLPSTSATFNKVSFFDVVAGARDPIGGYTKTREQTNLPKPRTFGNDIFVITEFRFDVQVVPDNRNTANFQADTLLQATYGRYLSEYLTRFCDQGVFNFDIDSETVLTLSKPLATCPAGFGVALQQIPVATGVAPALNQEQIGARPSASQANVYQLDPPQLMEPERQFTASIEYPYYVPGTNWWAYPDAIAQSDVYINVGLLVEGFKFIPNS